MYVYLYTYVDILSLHVCMQVVIRCAHASVRCRRHTNTRLFSKRESPLCTWESPGNRQIVGKQPNDCRMREIGGKSAGNEAEIDRRSIKGAEIRSVLKICTFFTLCHLMYFECRVLNLSLFLAVNGTARLLLHTYVHCALRYIQ